jgi:hypothetical protein
MTNVYIIKIRDILCNINFDTAPLNRGRRLLALGCGWDGGEPSPHMIIKNYQTFYTFSLCAGDSRGRSRFN